MTLGASERMDRTQAKLGLSVVVLLVIAMVSLACGSGGGTKPEAVVSKFWAALEQNDQDTMLDCIEPSLRPGLDPFSQVVPPGVDWLVVSLEWLQRETGTTFLELGKMRYEELDNDGSIAHVPVSGRVRLAEDIPVVGGVVREFQLTQTAVNKDDAWYLTSP